jgi:alkyl sulfatase BDS1-like metallo-beta-lactamase superfamily hydrolase
VAQLTPTQLFDSLAISVNGPRAWDLDLAIDVTLTDLGVNHRLTLRNGVLTHRERPADDTASLTLTLTKTRLLQLLGGDLASSGIDAAGDQSVLPALLGVLDQGDPSFNIITP